MKPQTYEMVSDDSKDLLKEIEDAVPNAEWWLNTGNTLFHGRKPIELIGTPEEYRLRAVIRAIKYGGME